MRLRFSRHRGSPKLPGSIAIDHFDNRIPLSASGAKPARSASFEHKQASDAPPKPCLGALTSTEHSQAMPVSSSKPLQRRSPSYRSGDRAGSSIFSSVLWRPLACIVICFTDDFPGVSEPLLGSPVFEEVIGTPKYSLLDAPPMTSEVHRNLCRGVQCSTKSPVYPRRSLPAR